MSRPAVFVDRDGTLIADMHYLSDPEQVVLEAHAAEGLRAIASLGLQILVATNQSGVARGYFTMAQAEAVNRRVDALLLQHGVTILDWFVCPHAESDNCICRKPASGLLERAAKKHDLDLQASFVIGDKCSDLELARRVGATGILVTTGQGAAAVEWARSAGFAVCRNLLEAGTAIEGEMASRVRRV